MKINRYQSNKKLFAAAGALLLVLLILGSYVFMNRQSFFGSEVQKEKTEESSTRAINYDEPTKEQIELGNETKKQTVEKGTADDTSTPNSNITITANSVSDNTLRIRTLISEIVSSGKCVLALANTKNSEEIITEEAEVQNLPNSSTCKGFDISLDRLASSDTWKLRITYSSAGAQRGEVTKEINITEQRQM
jgi:cytoskeletal protein RodZ